MAENEKAMKKKGKGNETERKKQRQGKEKARKSTENVWKMGTGPSVSE